MQELRNKLWMVEPYPKGMRAIPQPIAGTAFFPGGTGIWKEVGVRQSRSRRRPIMVLGHDFDSEVAYQRSFEIGDETHGPTWRNLRRLFDETGILMSECFFTNYFMGMRVGNISTGRSPASYSDEFVERCGDFLIEQLKLIRPSVLLTLGVFVPRMIGSLSDGLAGWQSARNFADIDRLGPLHFNVRFRGYSGRVHVVSLTHPSFQGPNVRHRRYRRAQGIRAEIKMLKDSLNRLEQGKKQREETGE